MGVGVLYAGGMIRIDHIQICIDRGYGIRAHCGKCRRFVELDLHKLGERLGYDHSTMHDDMVPKLVCSKCGKGTEISLTLHLVRWDSAR